MSLVTTARFTPGQRLLLRQSTSAVFPLPTGPATPTRNALIFVVSYKKAGCQPNAARFSQNRTVCKNCGADPPVRGRPPGQPSRLDEIDLAAKSGSRGTRADQGVRPTTFAEFSEL